MAIERTSTRMFIALAAALLLAGLAPAAAIAAEDSSQESRPVSLTTSAMHDLANATVVIEELQAITGDDGEFIVQHPKINVWLDGDFFEASERCDIQWRGDRYFPETETTETVLVEGPSWPNGNYSVQITANADKYPDYCGETWEYYEIGEPLNLDAQIELQMVGIRGYGFGYEYTGSPVELNETLTRNGKVLKRGVDYAVSFHEPARMSRGDLSHPVEPIEMGDYVAVFSGRGIYSGYTLSPFSIGEAWDEYDLRDAQCEADFFFAGSMPKNFKPVIRSCFGRKLKVGRDFVVDHYEVQNQKTGKWKKLAHFDGKKVGQYRVIIKAAKGSKYHGVPTDQAWFQVMDPRDLRWAQVEFDRYAVATGKASNPSNPIKSVTLNGKELERGKDYKVVYCKYGRWLDPECGEGSKKKPKETASVYKTGHYVFGIIPGKGTKSKPCKFKQTQRFNLDHGFSLIAKNSLIAAEVDIPELIVANRKTGKIPKPSITVTIGGMTLSKSAYTVKYEPGWDVIFNKYGDPVHPKLNAPTYISDYTVFIQPTSKSGFVDQKRVDLMVRSPFDLSVAKVDLAKSDYAYTGKAIKPELSLAAADGVALKAGKDYRLQYRDADEETLKTAPSKKGVYEVRAVGLKKYKDSHTDWIPFEIVKTKPEITASDKSVAAGQTVRIGAKANSKGKMTFESSNTKIAKVNSKGVITGVRAGKAKITITVAEKGKYAEGTKTIKVTVK